MQCKPCRTPKLGTTHSSVGALPPGRTVVDRNNKKNDNKHHTH